MKTTCPHCGSGFDVDEAYLNQYANCLSCGRPFVISDLNRNESVLKPIKEEQKVQHVKKDMVFFWIAFPFLYVLYFIVTFNPHVQKSEGSTLICAIFAFALSFGSKLYLREKLD